MSFCSNCGAEMTEGTAFCPSCGTAQVQQTNTPEVQQDTAGTLTVHKTESLNYSHKSKTDSYST